MSREGDSRLKTFCDSACDTGKAPYPKEPIRQSTKKSMVIERKHKSQMAYLPEWLDEGVVVQRK